MDHNARVYQNSPSQQLENFALKNPLGTRPCYLIADTADTMDYLKKFLSFPKVHEVNFFQYIDW